MVWDAFVLSLFGKLALIPCCVCVLFRKCVVGVRKLMFAPESAMADHESNADTKAVFLLCRLLVKYDSNLVSTSSQDLF